MAKKSMKKRYGWLLVIGIIGITLVLLRYAGLFDRINIQLLQEKAHIFEAYVKQHWFLSLFLFCFLFMVVTILSLPVTILLTVASGYLFGVTVGTIASVVGATLGGCIVFLIVRYVIGSWVQHRYSAQLRVFNHEVKYYGGYYLLMLQILPVTPVFIINLFAGVSPLSLWTYFWATIIGLLPGTLIYTLAGQKLHTIDSLKDILSWHNMAILALLAAASLIPMILKRLIWPGLKEPN
jgi:uncharacterized membrane protein YdjX (TVP38/TMEM64 family)